MKPSTNGVLEFIRLSLIGVVSYLLTEGVIDFIVEQTIGMRLDPVYKIQITTLVTFIIKSIDRYLHERGVETKDNGYLGKKGLTGF